MERERERETLIGILPLSRHPVHVSWSLSDDITGVSWSVSSVVQAKPLAVGLPPSGRDLQRLQKLEPMARKSGPSFPFGLASGTINISGATRVVTSSASSMPYRAGLLYKPACLPSEVWNPESLEETKRNETKRDGTKQNERRANVGGSHSPACFLSHAIPAGQPER